MGTQHQEIEEQEDGRGAGLLLRYLRGDGKTNSWTADRSSFPCCDYGEVLMKPMIGEYVFIVSLVSFPFALASSSSVPSTPAPSDRGSAIFR